MKFCDNSIRTGVESWDNHARRQVADVDNHAVPNFRYRLLSFKTQLRLGSSWSHL